MNDEINTVGEMIEWLKQYPSEAKLMYRSSENFCGPYFLKKQDFGKEGDAVVIFD